MTPMKFIYTSRKNLRLQISARRGSFSTQMPSIRRRGKWETLAKAETSLGGSDARELAAAGGRDVMDGVAPREGFRSALL